MPLRPHWLTQRRTHLCYSFWCRHRTTARTQVHYCGDRLAFCLWTLALHIQQHKQNYKRTSVTASTATALLHCTAVGHIILCVGGPSMSIDSGTNTHTAYYPVGGPGPSMSLKSHRTYLVSNTLVSERTRTHHPVGLLSLVTCTIEKASYSNT